MEGEPRLSLLASVSAWLWFSVGSLFQISTYYCSKVLGSVEDLLGLVLESWGTLISTCIELFSSDEASLQTVSYLLSYFESTDSKNKRAWKRLVYSIIIGILSIMSDTRTKHLAHSDLKLPRSAETASVWAHNMFLGNDNKLFLTGQNYRLNPGIILTWLVIDRK